MITSTPTHHRLLAATVVAALAVLSACGGSDATSATTTQAVADSAAPADTSAPADTAAAGNTVAPADTTLDAAAPADAGEPPAASSGEYGPMATTIEFLGDRTTPIATPLVDGMYYAGTASATGGTVTLTLGQWFICDGDALAEHPTVDCASGFGTLDDPSAEVTVAPDALVTVNTGDLDTFAKAGVSVAEFARLISGQAPSAEAPAGYAYIPYLLFVQVKNGVAVEVEQVYTS